jgi:hypothetical protein
VGWPLGTRPVGGGADGALPSPQRRRRRAGSGIINCPAVCSRNPQQETPATSLPSLQWGTYLILTAFDCPGLTTTLEKSALASRALASAQQPPSQNIISAARARPRLGLSHPPTLLIAPSAAAPIQQLQLMRERPVIWVSTSVGRGTARMAGPQRNAGVFDQPPLTCLSGVPRGPLNSGQGGVGNYFRPHGHLRLRSWLRSQFPAQASLTPTHTFATGVWGCPIFGFQSL